MDESNAAPVQNTSEASDIINTQQSNNSGLTAEQVAQYLGTDKETLDEFTKFTNANGKFDKAFSVFKSRISNPNLNPSAQAEQPAQPAQPAQPVQAEQPTQQAQPVVQPRKEGVLSPNDLNTLTYFDRLAGSDAYKDIAEDIRNGNIIKEMNSFGIRAFYDDGSVDDKLVRQFLDMKAQTVVAKQTSATPIESSAPTVDYVQVGETINSMQEAMAVLQQDSALKMQGRGGHPSAAKAEEFMRSMLNGGNK